MMSTKQKRTEVQELARLKNERPSSIINTHWRQNHPKQWARAQTAASSVCCLAHWGKWYSGVMVTATPQMLPKVQLSFVKPLVSTGAFERFSHWHTLDEIHPSWVRVVEEQRTKCQLGHVSFLGLCCYTSTEMKMAALLLSVTSMQEFGWECCNYLVNLVV